MIATGSSNRNWGLQCYAQPGPTLACWASMTSPKAVRDLLMDWASFICSPVTSLFFSRSEPQAALQLALPFHMNLNGCPSNVHMVTWSFPSLDYLMSRATNPRKHGPQRSDPKQTCQIAQGELATWDLAQRGTWDLKPPAGSAPHCSNIFEGRHEV